VTADQCSRISREFLEQERLDIGETWYRQEHECVFTPVVNAAFSYDDIEAALDPSVKPLHIHGVDGDAEAGPPDPSLSPLHIQGVDGDAESDMLGPSIKPLEKWGLDRGNAQDGRAAR
jgi:hypothetical protein